MDLPFKSISSLYRRIQILYFKSPNKAFQAPTVWHITVTVSQYLVDVMLVISMFYMNYRIKHINSTSNNKWRRIWIHTVLQHARKCIIIQVSQCKGVKLAPLWPLSLELGPVFEEVGDTGTSKVGLGICKAACLLFLEPVLVWRGEEVSPVELAAWRTPQLPESSGEGSVAGLLSGQVGPVWGFPWGHDVDRSGERVADSSRPLVPCVHWGSARKGRRKNEKWWDKQVQLTEQC